MDHLQEIYEKTISKQEIVSLQDAISVVIVFKTIENKMNDMAFDNMWKKCLRLAVQKIASMLEQDAANQVISQQQKMQQQENTPDPRYVPKEKITDAEKVFQLMTNVKFKVENAPIKPKDRRKEILKNACEDLLEPLKAGLLTYEAVRDLLLRACYHTEQETKGLGKFTPFVAEGIIEEVLQAFTPTLLAEEEEEKKKGDE